MPSITASAIVGSAALSAGASVIGSSQAAGAAKSAANLEQARYLDTANRLSPYNVAGQAVLDPLNALALAGPTGGLPDYLGQAAANVPLQMTQSQLERTPGYQFTLGEGLKAVQSSAAARGLGVSGAALKGAAGYATGLANATYKDQFNIAQQRFSDYLDLQKGGVAQTNAQAARLQSVANLGENAAAQIGTTGATLGTAQANMLNTAGQAQAAGTVGVGTAATGAVQNYLSNQAYQAYLQRLPVAGGQQFGPPAPGVAPPPG